MERRRFGCLLVLALSLPAFAATDPLYEQAQKKMDLIESGRVKRGSVILFTPAEINAWVRGKTPQVVGGVRETKIELGPGTIKGFALIDLVQMRQAQGGEVNPLVAALISGEHPVEVDTRVESAHGKCTVFLTQVEFSGAALSGGVLDFLIKSFFQPMFPDAKIEQPFTLREPIDRLDVRPDGVRVYIKPPYIKKV